MQIVALLALLTNPAVAAERHVGGYGFLTLGGGLGQAPLAGLAMLDVGFGAWFGYYDPEYLSGRFLGIGPGYRLTHGVNGMRHDLVGELRLHQELVLGGAYVALAGGPQVRTDLGCSLTPCDTSLGWTSRLGIGLRLLLAPNWALTVRLDGGVEAGWTGRGNLGIGVEFL